MGGYVNLALRNEGVVRKDLSYTGVLRKFTNPRLYSGAKGAFAPILRMYKNCIDETFPEARTLAPFSYGLVVIDQDTKSVLSMQNFNNLGHIPLTAYDHDSYDHLPTLLNKGWIDLNLYSEATGAILCKIAPPRFKTSGDVLQWVSCLHNKYRYIDSALAETGDFRLDNYLMPFFKMRPAGWEFQNYCPAQGPEFQKALVDRGFQFTEHDAAIWAAWNDGVATKAASKAAAEGAKAES